MRRVLLVAFKVEKDTGAEIVFEFSYLACGIISPMSGGFAAICGIVWEPEMQLTPSISERTL